MTELVGQVSVLDEGSFEPVLVPIGGEASHVDGESLRYSLVYASFTECFLPCSVGKWGFLYFFKQSLVFQNYISVLCLTYLRKKHVF